MLSFLLIRLINMIVWRYRRCKEVVLEQGLGHHALPRVNGLSTLRVRAFGQKPQRAERAESVHAQERVEAGA